MIKKIIILTFFSLFMYTNAPATEELWLHDIPVSKLYELYKKIGYTGTEEKNWLMLKSQSYPAVLLKNFPPDFNSITDREERNALFIKILAPLALKLNQQLWEERQTIVNIKKSLEDNNSLTSEQLNIIENKASKYDIYTPYIGDSRRNFLIRELLNRIDIIPPSIMITIAAIETDFGSSRVVKEGNSLYKILVWHTSSGLKPIGETEDDSYRIKIYPDIFKSMEDFALRINSSPNFEFLRVARSQMRKSITSPQIMGSDFAAYSFPNSELRNYAGIIDYTSAYYELSIIDRSSLGSLPLTPDISKQFSKFLIKK